MRGSLRWSALVYVATLAFYLGWVPRFLRYSSPPTGDQPFYLMDAASLAQDRDLDVKNNYDDGDFDKFYALAPHPPDFIGMAAPYPLPPQLAPNSIRAPEEEYSHHLPGLGLLLFPAWKLGGWFHLWWPGTIVAMCALSALLATNIFLFALQASASPRIAAVVWLALSFSTPILPYSYMIFTELSVGLLVIYALRRLSLGWQANGWDRLLAVGLCIAYVPWLAWRCVLLSATLTVYALWQWWTSAHPPAPESTPVEARRARGASVLLVLAPVAVSAALILGFHFFLYGRPFPDNRVPELGNASPFHWPWGGGAELTKFLTNVFGLFFDMGFGLLPWAPVYVLAIAGAVALQRSSDRSLRQLVPALSMVVAPYLLVLGAFEFWAGIWCPPARYLTSLVPLAAAPLGALLAGGSRRWRRIASLALFVSLAIPGWGLAAALLHDARWMWPSGFSAAFAWLAAKLPGASIDLRRWIPVFTQPDETRLPYLLGAWLLGCAVLVVAGAALSSRPRVSRSRSLMVWAGAVAAVAGAGLWVASPFLKHKTELVEQGRWQLGVAQENPRGIAYHDGAIYVACYGRAQPSGGADNGRVLVLDLATGASRTLPLVADGIELEWSHPGDVELGPDGLLYVVNNGPGDRALLAVRADGEVVRRLPMPGSTAATTALAIHEGAFYVADMSGGAVRRYFFPVGSDTPEARTIVDGLNNPSAVAIDGEGRLYVNEGFALVRQLSPDGELLRKLESCAVRSLEAPPEPSPWIDASCDQSLFSIETTKPSLQLVRVKSSAPLEAIITALAHGDGLLYTLQGGTLVAYRIER